LTISIRCRGLDGLTVWAISKGTRRVRRAECYLRGPEVPALPSLTSSKFNINYAIFFCKHVPRGVKFWSVGPLCSLDLTASRTLDKSCSTHAGKTRSTAYVTFLCPRSKYDYYYMSKPTIAVNGSSGTEDEIHSSCGDRKRVWFGERDIIDVSRKVTTYDLHSSVVARLAQRMYNTLTHTHTQTHTHQTGKKRRGMRASSDNIHNG